MQTTEVNKYWQISDYLIDKINNKDFKIGEKLPSEMELSDRFKVNRYTVRQAMSKLVNLELAEALQGKGYFVTAKPPELIYPISSQTQFSQRMKQMGKEHAVQLLDWKLDLPSQHEAEQLKIDRDEYVYHLEIVRSVEKKVLSYSTTTLRAKFIPGFDQYMHDLKSLYGLLKEKYYIVPSRQYSMIQARLPFSNEAQHLHISLESPLLIMESVSNHPSGEALEYNYTRIRGDMNKCFIQVADVTSIPLSSNK